VREALIQWLGESGLPQLSGDFLRAVPGMPPIMQSLHLLGLIVLMASIVMICLRVLNIAARRQDTVELAGRLFPWFFWALPLMLFSALPFLLARPQRYFYNPVFSIKMAALFVALTLSLILWRQWRKGLLAVDSAMLVNRIMALLCLLAWLLTALGGRWIAYADYLFWSGY
tara:strand:+ start:71 stop:583 length:513 start_codon:yes stop_codon:yes gene_type:complete